MKSQMMHNIIFEDEDKLHKFEEFQNWNRRFEYESDRDSSEFFNPCDCKHEFIECEPVRNENVKLLLDKTLYINKKLLNFENVHLNSVLYEKSQQLKQINSFALLPKSKKVQKKGMMNRMITKFKELEQQILPQIENSPERTRSSTISCNNCSDLEAKFISKSNPKIESSYFNENLTFRNIKTNFGTGIVQYVEFLREMSILEKNFENQQKYREFGEWCNRNQQNFRSYEGWKIAWRDQKYGKTLRKICLDFFGNSIAKSYVLTSKIRIEYRDHYIDKVHKFFCGAAKPRLFSSPYFKS